MAHSIHLRKLAMSLRSLSEESSVHEGNFLALIGAIGTLVVFYAEICDWT
jgi:hypothetical protein